MSSLSRKEKVFVFAAIPFLLAGIYFNFFVPTSGPAKAAPLFYLLDEQARPTATATPKPCTPVVYLVRVGDTLWALAQRYGVTVEELQRVNGIPKGSSLIKAGETIRIPCP